MGGLCFRRFLQKFRRLLLVSQPHVPKRHQRIAMGSVLQGIVIVKNKEKYILKRSGSYDHYESQQAFGAGMAAMIPNGSWIQNESGEDIEDEIRMMPVPFMDEALKDENGEYINYDFKNRKPKNYFYSSEQGLATLLNLPKSTIAYNIPLLLKLKLLYRNKRLKYKNEAGKSVYKIVQFIPGNTQSIFVVPYEVLAVELRSTYEPQKIDFIENADEIEITDEALEKVYAELRAEADAPIRRVGTNG